MSPLKYVGSIPTEPTTEGRQHWYLVCARDEKHANLCGPFFDTVDAAAELRIVEEQVAAGKDACDKHHFLMAGPAPLDKMSCLRPNVYDDGEAFDWWDRWAYSHGGEYHRIHYADIIAAAAASSPATGLGEAS